MADPKQVDCVILGAGPAGLSAAAILSHLGIETLVLDENPAPGGQYYRAPNAPARHSAPFLAYLAEGRDRLVAAIDEAHATIVTGAQVYAVTPEREVSYWTIGASGTTRVVARAVLVATGAYEAINPFPGWTLPGVTTLGGAQNLLKTQGLLAGIAPVTAGSGPFLWLVSQQLLRAGARVQAVAEAAPLGRSIAFGIASIGELPMAMEGAGYWARILASGARFRMGWGVLKAEGTDRLERVTLAPYSRSGRLDASRARALETDALCVSNTLVPATQITQSLGCDGDLDPVSGAVLPRVSRLMQTTVEGVFAAGEAVGLGGEPKAVLDGKVAGWGIAARLGAVSETGALSESQRDHDRAAARRALTKAMFAAYAPPPLDPDLLDETLVCRCEEINGAAVRAAIQAGDGTADLVKSRSRAGMGACQGRMCGRTVQALLGQSTGTGIAPGFTPRMPFKPIPISALLAQDGATE